MCHSVVPVYKLFGLWQKRSPAIKTGSLYCPLCTLGSCIKLCWFSGIFWLFSLILMIENYFGEDGSGALPPQSVKVPACEQSHGSVKKEAHSIFQVCFVLSHKDRCSFVTFFQPEFSRRVKTKRLARRNYVVPIPYSPFLYKIVTCSFLAAPSLSLSVCLQACLFIFIVSR